MNTEPIPRRSRSCSTLCMACRRSPDDHGPSRAFDVSRFQPAPNANVEFVLQRSCGDTDLARVEQLQHRAATRSDRLPAWTAIPLDPVVSATRHSSDNHGAFRTSRQSDVGAAASRPMTDRPLRRTRPPTPTPHPDADPRHPRRPRRRLQPRRRPRRPRRHRRPTPTPDPDTDPHPDARHRRRRRRRRRPRRRRRHPHPDPEPDADPDPGPDADPDPDADADPDAHPDPDAAGCG